MNFGKVASTEKATKDKLILEVQEDRSGLECFNPVLNHLFISIVKLQALSLGHEDETPHLGVGVFQMGFLEPRVLAVEDASLHGVILAVELDESVPD